MKRTINYLIALAITAFTFTSCEDVPSPFGNILPPDNGEKVVVEPTGSGTAADPYNVAAVLEFVSGLGADTQSSDAVYIKGIVSEVQEVDVSGTYGNATYYISDDADGKANKFMIYRGFGLGGKKFNEGATPVKAGDNVIIKSKVVNYKGNTPETVSNNCIIVELNGVKDEGGDTPQPSGDVKTVTVAQFIAAPESATQWYQLTGTVKNLKDGDQYGNFDLEDATGSVYVYGLLAEQGGESKKFQELVAAKGIKNGCKLTLNGLRSSYNGNVQVKSAYFVKVEAGEGGDDSNAKGSGTLADPYNAAGANKYISTLDADKESDNDVYIKGKIVKYANNGEFGTQYGNASFYISDDGKESSEQFYVFRTLYLGNVKYEGGVTPVVGDEVVICGKVVNYKGNTPETASNKSYIYSLNGKTSADSGGDTGGAKGTGTQNDPFNIAAAIAKCQQIGETASTEKYYVKGIVVKAGTASGGYGNVTFTMGDTSDANEVFTAYQVAGSDGEALADGYVVPKGAEVIVYGPLVNYKGNTPETSGKSAAQIVTINGKKTSETGGGQGGGGATGGSDITVDFSSLGLSNQEKPSTLTLSDGTTLSFDGGGNSNAPAYYNTGTALRMYPKNTMVIKAGSKKIAAIEITCDEYQGTLYNASGDITVDSKNMTVDGVNLKYSGPNASSATVANTSTGTGAPSQLRMKILKITYGN